MWATKVRATRVMRQGLLALGLVLRDGHLVRVRVRTYEAWYA